MAKKYEVGGGIDFFAELYKSLDEDDKENQDETKQCLISGTPLTEHFVTLPCNHSFNYLPLFYDIKNHKTKFNEKETNGRLHKHQLRCPYCRKISDELLPFIPELGVPKIPHVNAPRPPFHRRLYLKKCSAFIMYYNHCTTPEPPEFPQDGHIYFHSITASKEGWTSQCSMDGFPLNYCSGKHSMLGDNEYVLEGENYGDDRCYCAFHKSKIIPMYKKKAIEKFKQEKLAKKLELKLEIQNLKQKLKEEKLAAKEAKLLEKKQEKEKEKQNKTKKPKLFHQPLDHSVSSFSSFSSFSENTILTCVAILKTGPNKGHSCGKHVTPLGDGTRCKRHLKPDTLTMDIDLDVPTIDTIEG